MRFFVTWDIVGELFSNDMISGIPSSSIIHLIVRAITLIVLISIVSVGLRVIKFIITVPLWIWVIIGGVLTPYLLRCLAI